MTAPKLVHPVFCGGPDAGCTVIDRDLPYSGTVHRSRPVVLNLSGSADARVFGSTVATVHLEQHRASYETDVYVVVRYRDGELALPVDVAQVLLAEVGKLVGRASPPPHLPENLYPAQVATRHGSPAGRWDDECPQCGYAYGTVWHGSSDFSDNHWSHTYWHPDAAADGDPPPCGLHWTTPVRRPGTGAQFVGVFSMDADGWSAKCWFCRARSDEHATEADAQAWADQHTADHETQVTR